MNKVRVAAAARRPTRGSTQPLRWDPLLAKAALVHSQDMARNHYLGHVGTRGDSPCDRLAQAGVRWQAMGENLARSSTVAEAEKAFMNEPDEKSNHRSNILNPDFNYVGVGIARGKDGMIYITQEFAEESSLHCLPKNHERKRLHSKPYTDSTEPSLP
ncbi:MAG TPA: CAP domain-containing protein [Terriglobia bacterium]|nr:CAP domain-containing protein [Terriglobia bacterium]